MLLIRLYQTPPPAGEATVHKEVSKFIKNYKPKKIDRKQAGADLRKISELHSSITSREATISDLEKKNSKLTLAKGKVDTITKRMIQKGDRVHNKIHEARKYVMETRVDLQDFGLHTQKVKARVENNMKEQKNQLAKFLERLAQPGGEQDDHQKEIHRTSKMGREIIIRGDGLFQGLQHVLIQNEELKSQVNIQRRQVKIQRHLKEATNSLTADTNATRLECFKQIARMVKRVNSQKSYSYQEKGDNERYRSSDLIGRLRDLAFKLVKCQQQAIKFNETNQGKLFSSIQQSALGLVGITNFSIGPVKLWLGTNSPFLPSAFTQILNQYTGLQLRNPQSKPKEYYEGVIISATYGNKFFAQDKTMVKHVESLSKKLRTSGKQNTIQEDDLLKTKYAM